MINSNCIADGDLIHISRDCKDYKTTFEQLQYDVTDFGHLPKLPCIEVEACNPDLDTGMPWDKIPPTGARFHLKNIVGDMYWKGSQASEMFIAWDMDGNDITKDIEDNWWISSVTEMVVMTAGMNNYLWHESEGTWDFGELTDTCKLKDFSYMFLECINFNSDLSMFDFRNCIKMTRMFSQTFHLDQDMSDLCIPKIPVHPGKVFLDSKMQYMIHKHPQFGKNCSGKNS